MPSIRITQFAGLTPEIHSRIANKTIAQVAHNCLLWDGSLRPMPQWQKMKKFNLVEDNFFYENSKDGTLLNADYFYDAVYLNGEPLANKVLVGIDKNTYTTQGYRSNVRVTDTFDLVATSLPAGLPTPTFDTLVVDGVTEEAYIPTSSVTYVSQNYSQKPVNRIIGITFCRQTKSGLEESPIAVLPGQAPFGIMFEGDILKITMAPDLDLLAQYGITHIRLYRTISGLDSGEQAGNELDTDWHLINTMPVSANMRYNDGGASTTDPLDLYLAKHFYAPQFRADHFGLTESGWFFMASSGGRIAMSERFLHHAWPTENGLTIPETITDAVTYDDNLYIGTRTFPYIVALAPGEGEQGLQASAKPFSERLACLPRTMVAAPGGAIYAAKTGIVALSRAGAKVLTAGLTHAGDVLFKKRIAATETTPAYTETIKIERTNLGAYWNGKYFGFVTSNEPAEVTP